MQRGVDEVVVIGGAEIFRATLASADRIYLTLVHGQPAGDTRLDAFDPAVWTETAREPMPQGPGDQYPADFIVLERQALIAAAYMVLSAHASPYTHCRTFICAHWEGAL